MSRVRDLHAQGQIYRRATETDEKVPDIAPEYRGRVSPDEEALQNKPFFSEDTQKKDELSRPERDGIATEVDKHLGPIAVVKDKLADTIEDSLHSGKEKLSATTETPSETKNSAAGALSQYTQAAWEKMNALKPTLGAIEPAKQTASSMDDKESTLKQRMAEISEKGRHEIATGRVADHMPSAHNIAYKLAAPGGDDVFKILGDGASRHEDPAKANLRVTTEMLI